MMEKRAQTGVIDIRELVKQADHEEAVLVGDYRELLGGKKTFVLVATGPRAETLEKLLKEARII